MTTPDTSPSVSRRTALAGLGAGGLGLALAATTHPVAAQESTPAAMAGHPILGTWVIVRNIAKTDEVPVVVAFTADGSFIDPGQGVAGSWEPTGPTSAAMTIVPFLDPAGGYAVVRGTWEVDAGGGTMTGPAFVTVVGPDGAVVATDHFQSRATRLPARSGEQGTPLADFPTWTAPPAAATPTS